MSLPPDNGAYYTAQEKSPYGLDPFAVLGLPADTDGLTQASARLHARTVLHHVFERSGLGSTTSGKGGLTAGLRVPLWRHVNDARSMIACNEDDFQSLRLRWIHRGSMQTWNPLAPVGSAEALRPREVSHSSKKPSVYQEVDLGKHARGMGTAEDPFSFDDLEDEEEEEDVILARSPPKRHPRTQRGAVSPQPPHLRSSPPPTYLRSTAGSHPPPHPYTQRGAFDPRPPPPASNPPSAQPEPTTRSRRSVHSSTSKNPRADTFDTPSATTAEPPSATASRGRTAASARNPATPSKRRLEPRGIYLGTWRKSGLRARYSNAVYGSQDAKGRINRRISKEDAHGSVVHHGAYDCRRTACSHHDIDYVGNYRNMTKEEVDAAIVEELTNGGRRGGGDSMDDDFEDYV
ncbi:MAG: hypothetical protein Q9218_005805 [Villophora microphyllina]